MMMTLEKNFNTMKNKFYVGLIALALIAITACDNGNQDVDIIPGPSIVGTWTMAPVANSLAVGPDAGSSEWWGISDADVTTRACFYDDTWTFGEDGSLTINMGADTWLEGWQGGGDSCGAPVAPFNGGAYSYSYNESSQTLTTNGVGAFIGLPKVTNNGELGNHVDAGNPPSSVDYTVFSLTETSAEIRISFVDGGGTTVHWTYLLERQ